MRKLSALIVFILLILSTDAAAQRFVKSFNTLQDMISVNPNDLNNAAMCSGLTTAGDGTGGLFYYNASSTAATNTTDVFKPLQFSGRWIRIPTTTFIADSATIGRLTVTTNAALTYITAGRAIATDGANNLTNSITTATELGYLHGVTSAIQTQIDSKLTSPVDLGSGNASGTLAAGRFPALTGDVTTSSGSLATTLATVATPGTSTKVTYNAKGLVTSGTSATLASSDFANQGTTTTVLHGNASGNPSFGSVVEGDLGLTDVTTANTSTSKHGFAPKLDGNSAHFLDGTGAFSTPSGGGGSGTNYTFSAQFGIVSATNVFIASGSIQTNNIWKSGSTQVMQIYTGHPQVLFGDGSTEGDAGFPFIAAALNSGYGINPCTVGGYGEWIVNQNARLRVDSSGFKVTSAGSASSPPISSTGATQTGLFWRGSAGLGFTGGGVNTFNITNNYVVTTNLAINEVYYTWPTSSASGFFKANGATPNALSLSAVDLSSSDVTGNLGISHFNSGSGASSSTYWRGDGTWQTVAGSGTVTSVGLSAPAQFSVSGTPVTTSGTLALSWANVSSNKFLAGPINNGAAAAPTMRLLDISDFASGTGASSSTFWRGDGTWNGVTSMANGGNTLSLASDGTMTLSHSSTTLITAGGPSTDSSSSTLGGMQFYDDHFSTNGVTYDIISRGNTWYDDNKTAGNTVFRLPGNSAGAYPLTPGTEFGFFSTGANFPTTKETITVTANIPTLQIADQIFDNTAFGNGLIGENGATIKLAWRPSTNAYAATGGTSTSVWQVVEMTGRWSVGGISYQNGNIITNYPIYAAGTAYSITTSSSALDFGTTDPVITITVPGTYLLQGSINWKYNNATFDASRTVTSKFRRTNNTAQDISNSSTAFNTAIVTGITDTAIYQIIPAVVYTTANSNDAITIYAGIDTGPTVGSFDAVEANIVATRLY